MGGFQTNDGGVKQDMMKSEQCLKDGCAGTKHAENEIQRKMAPRDLRCLGEQLYISALVVFIGLTLFDQKTVLSEMLPSWLFSMGRYVCLALMVAKILICRDFEHYDRPAIMRILLASAICGAATVVSGSRLPLQYLIIIIAAYGVAFERIARLVLLAELLMVFAVMLATMFGLIPNDFHIRNSNGVIRHNLGFAFAAYPAIFTYYLSTLYLFVRKERVKPLESGAIVILNAVLFILTDTKTELIMAVCAVVGFMLLRRNSAVVGKILRHISVWIMPVLTVLSIILAVGYRADNPVYRDLNSALSGRLSLAHKAMDEYGATPFGNEIEWIDLSTIEAEGLESSAHNIVDNGYLHILYNYGYVFLAAFILAYSNTLRWCIARGDLYTVLLISIMAVHMFITPQMIQIVYNVTLVLLVATIIPRKS